VLEAGGAGFILLLDALLHVAAGRPLPEPPPASLPAYSALGPGVSAAAEGLRYEVVLLLESSQGRIDDLRAAWNRMGSSVVTVGGTAPGAAMSTPTGIGGVAPTGLPEGASR
jgi:uncharacterized protein